MNFKAAKYRIVSFILIPFSYHIEYRYWWCPFWLWRIDKYFMSINEAKEHLKKQGIKINCK